MTLFKRITGILLVACLGLAGIERVDADQPCEGILCGSGAANRHAARTGLLIGLAQLGQDLARAVTDRIYNSTFLGEDWFWGGMAESHNRSVNEKFGDLVGDHNYIGPEEVPGLRAVGAEIFNNVAMEAATAGIVSGGPLAQRGLRALRGMPKFQRGMVDVGLLTGRGWVQDAPARGETRLVESLRFEIGSGHEIAQFEARHGVAKVGAYSMERRGDILHIHNLGTDEAYRGSGFAGSAVKGYWDANPGLRFVESSMEEVNTVRFLDANAGRPVAEWWDRFLTETPLGKLRSKLGSEVRLHRMERDFDPTKNSNFYRMTVEITR